MFKRLFHTLLLLLIVTMPLWVGSKYLMQMFNMALIYLIIVMGLNYVIGFCGQVSFAQTAFWGIGAYISALLTLRLGISFWVALPLSALGTTIAGVVIGFPTLRLKQFYLGIATIGFGEIVNLILLNWTSLTGGSIGIPGIPKPKIGNFVIRNDFQFYYILLAVTLVLFFVTIFIKNSRFGRGLLAIGDDELAAEVMGVPTHKYKIKAFALSAFYAGAAGSLYAHLISYISPDLFIFRQSITFLCMLMIGGSGYIAGPVIGAILLTMLPEWMRPLKDFYMGIYGGAVILLAILMPKGIVGLIEKYAPLIYVWLEPYADVPVALLKKEKVVEGLNVSNFRNKRGN